MSSISDRGEFTTWSLLKVKVLCIESRSNNRTTSGKLISLMLSRSLSSFSQVSLAPFITHKDRSACSWLRYRLPTSSPHLLPQTSKTTSLRSMSTASVLSLSKSEQAFSHTGLSQSNKLLSSKSNRPRSLSLHRACVKRVSSGDLEIWTAYVQHVSVFSINTSASSSVCILTSQSKSLPPDDSTVLRDWSRAGRGCGPFSHDVKAFTTALRGKPSVSWERIAIIFVTISSWSSTVRKEHEINTIIKIKA